MDETKERNIYAPILQVTPLFKTLDESEIIAVLVHCVKREYKAGETILSEGETGNSMLIIVDGTVEYLKGKRKVGEDGIGGFFGEIALLAKGTAKRQATVKATLDCVLLEIYQPSFKELLKKHPEVGILVIQMLASRIQSAAPPTTLKSKVGLILVAMLVLGLTKLLTKLLPKEMANGTAQWLVDQGQIYVLPLLPGLGLLARHWEALRTKTKLSGK